MTVSTHVPQDNPCAMDGAHAQLRHTVITHGGKSAPMASGWCPCIRVGMLIHDAERNLFGTATLCTDNAVTYETDDARTFTIGYDAIGLEPARPDLGRSADPATPAPGGASIYKDESPRIRPRQDHDRHATSPQPETTRAGVRASVGDYVFFTDCDAEGELVGATDREAVIINQDGDVQVNWWRYVAVQASGLSSDLAATTAPTGVSIASALPSITHQQRADIDADPYRVAALRALDLMAHVDRIQDKYADLDRDRLAAVELLSQVEMALGTLSDNRTRRVLDGGEIEVSA